MAYRGFTWNLTKSEAVALARVLEWVDQHGAPSYIDADVRRLFTLYNHFKEVATDGSEAQKYFFADS
jgi:hypothetical protein